MMKLKENIGNMVWNNLCDFGEDWTFHQESLIFPKITEVIPYHIANISYELHHVAEVYCKRSVYALSVNGKESWKLIQDPRKNLDDV